MSGMMLKGETIHSMLPTDIPWWQFDHALFFGFVYIVIGVLGIGLALAVFRSWRDSCR